MLGFQTIHRFFCPEEKIALKFRKMLAFQNIFRLEEKITLKINELEDARSLIEQTIEKEMDFTIQKKCQKEKTPDVFLETNSNKIKAIKEGLLKKHRSNIDERLSYLKSLQ